MESGDEEEEEGEEDSSFVVADSQCSNQLTAADYAAIDRQREELDTVPPYFPRAFAKSNEFPLQFNFDLFLLDSLTLPCPILEKESDDQAKKFETRLEAIDYCKTRLQQWRQENRLPVERGQETARATAKSHPLIDKERLFFSEGRPLESLMQSGVEAYDANLGRVREDR